MEKVLLAARSELFCKAFREVADGRYLVDVCNDGLELLRRFQASKADILILDMELPEMDGLSALEVIRNNGYSIPVIALTSCIQSNYMVQMATKLNVSCIIPKPCVATAVLKKVHEVLDCVSGNEGSADVDHLIELVLLELNFGTHMCGYPCLVEAIKLYVEDPTQQITKTVYPAVAKLCGGSSKRVEHAMRCCIHNAWRSCNQEVWGMYFSLDTIKYSMPSNGKFVSRVAKSIRREIDKTQKDLATNDQL